MNNIKPVIIFLIFILSSCTQTFQNNGLSEKKLKDFDIKIGETSKKYLMIMLFIMFPMVQVIKLLTNVKPKNY